MDLCNISEINALLSRNGFRFSKSMGQNFLIAGWVPERIAAESGTDLHNGVLEIGPGVGCLTTKLAECAGRVAAVELDDRLLPVLSETVGGIDNVSIISGNIMKTDIASLIDDNFSGLTPVVCANLPYNITSPVLTKLIDTGFFETITVMIQKEVAQRICAKPASADYGAFTLYINYHTVPELLFDVPSTCFEPRPKVTSAVIRLKKREQPPVDVDYKLLFRIVRAAFNQRRKTLLNALSSAFSSELEKEHIAEAITECGFDIRIRGEVLSLEKFADITNKIERYFK